MRRAIIGGTGFYSFEKDHFSECIVETPHGPALVFMGNGEWSDLVFLPRHGPEHLIPPHKINYRANIKALHQLGVDRICATFAVGSLDKRYPPKALVVVDQFLDFTQGRECTFFDVRTDGVLHTDLTYPYSSPLRARLIEVGKSRKLKQFIESGCYVCINGPRFATVAEVQMYKLLGGHIVGMTGVPEATLAREIGIHYAGIAVVVGWEPGIAGEADTTELDNILEKNRSSVMSIFVEALRAEGDFGPAQRYL